MSTYSKRLRAGVRGWAAAERRGEAQWAHDPSAITEIYRGLFLAAMTSFVSGRCGGTLSLFQPARLRAAGTPARYSGPATKINLQSKLLRHRYNWCMFKCAKNFHKICLSIIPLVIIWEGRIRQHTCNPCVKKKNWTPLLNMQ